MFLDRIKNHIKQQNWFAIVLEVLIVILGVTLAFQINQWNESRKDQRAEVSILGGLSEEFELAKREIESDMRARGMMILRCKQLEDYRRGKVAMPDDSVRVVIESLMQFRFYTPSHPILVDIQSTGKFDLIRSKELRALLTRYIQEKERLFTMEERERLMVTNKLEPFLAKHLDLGLALSEDSDGYAVQCQRFFAITKDPEFGSFIYFKTHDTEQALRYSERVYQLILELKDNLSM